MQLKLAQEDDILSHLFSTDKNTPLAVHVPSFQVTLVDKHHKDLVLEAVALEKKTILGC